MNESIKKSLDIGIQNVLDKFSENLNLTEGSSGTAINPIGVQSSENRSKLVHLYNHLKNVLYEPTYGVRFMQNRIEVYIKSDQEEDPYTKYANSLLEYISSKENITPLPKVKLRRDISESSKFFGKTAYYDPTLQEIILYVEGRHPKDVLRSLSHEVVHHIQNLEGRLTEIKTTDVNQDPSLAELEKEAYLKGNMLFREWEDSYKNSIK